MARRGTAQHSAAGKARLGGVDDVRVFQAHGEGQRQLLGEAVQRGEGAGGEDDGPHLKGGGDNGGGEAGGGGLGQSYSAERGYLR